MTDPTSAPGLSWSTSSSWKRTTPLTNYPTIQSMRTWSVRCAVPFPPVRWDPPSLPSPQYLSFLPSPLLFLLQTLHYKVSGLVSERSISWRVHPSPSRLSCLSYPCHPWRNQQTKRKKQLYSFIVSASGTVRCCRVNPHPEQLHHQLPVLFILVFVLLFDFFQLVLQRHERQIDKDRRITSPSL